MPFLNTTSSSGPSRSLEEPLSTISTTSTMISTVTSWTRNHSVPVQNMLTTITRPLPDPYAATFSDECMTATGSRLAELNAQRMQSASAISTVTSMAPMDSAIITTRSVAMVTLTTATAPDLKSMSEHTATAGAQSTTVLPSPATDNSSASVGVTSVETVGTMSDEATADAAVPTDASYKDATTTVFVTAHTSNNTPVSDSTIQPMGSETATESPVVSTVFVTVPASLDTVSTTTTFPITTTFTLKTTSTLPDEGSAATSDTSVDAPLLSAGFITTSTSAALASFSSPAYSSAALDPERTEGIAHGPPHSTTATATATASSPAHPSTTSTAEPTTPPTGLVVKPISLGPSPIYSGPVTSITEHEDPHRNGNPYLARWLTVETPITPTSSSQISPTHPSRSTNLQSRYHHRHLSSPLPIWLALSIFVAVIAVIVWRFLAHMLARRRARAAEERIFDLRTCDVDGSCNWRWRGKPPRSGMRKRCSTEDGCGIEDGRVVTPPSPESESKSESESEYVSGQHASEPDPMCRPHERGR